MSRRAHTALRLMQRVAPLFKSPPQLRPDEWAVQHRTMSSAETAFVGRFSFALAPYFGWLLSRLADPRVRKVVCMKSAQVGWTQSVVLNILGWVIASARKNTLVLFPKEAAAKRFNGQKFEPMCRASKSLRDVFTIRSRDRTQSIFAKYFAWGFIEFLSGKSISDVKSASARLLIVEEPDDMGDNLKGQGDVIKLFEERGKSYRDLKIVVGGTPSIKGFSAIESEMLVTDRNYWMVPCPACGTYQRLTWRQVKWLKSESGNHPIYGNHLPESAYYECEHCTEHWDNDQKNAAILRGYARPDGQFRDAVGLYVNEMYSSMHGSRLAAMAERFLAAQHAFRNGDHGPMIEFTQASLGEPWEYRSSVSSEALELAALDYPEWSVPDGSGVITMGVDVQHDRLAIVVRAWGRDEESWLMHWGEIYGATLNPLDPVWDALADLLNRPYKSERLGDLHIVAASIDSSDGRTGDSVYTFVRDKRAPKCKVMAIKGSSDAAKEIFSAPKASIDLNRYGTKAVKYGVRPYLVGTVKAKDLLLGESGRLSLTGDGPGRMHHYIGVRHDYYQQLLSEVKVPRRGRRGHEYVLKPGQHNEALDCEVYCLHAARAARVHLMREASWDVILQAGRIADLKEPLAPRKDADPEEMRPNVLPGRGRGGNGWVPTRGWFN